MRQLRKRHEWLDHLARASSRYVEQRGNHFAAAITFFSLLTLVPLLMIAFAAAGYILSFNPSLLTDLKMSIAESVPTGLSDSITPVIDEAIEQRNTVAWFGLVGALWAGIWWMSNLREAVSAQWALPPLNPASPQRLLFDLLALVGLGTALISSVSITVMTTAFTETVLDVAGLADHGWNWAVFAALGVVLGVATNWLIFLWALTRLPRMSGPIRGAGKVALLGAIGFEVLEQGMTIYLGTVGGTPGGAVFGSLLGVLLFTYLVSRFVLYMTAWVATDGKNAQPVPVPVTGPEVVEARQRERAETTKAAPAKAIVAALAAGVLLGIGLRRRQKDRWP